MSGTAPRRCRTLATDFFDVFTISTDSSSDESSATCCFLVGTFAAVFLAGAFTSDSSLSDTGLVGFLVSVFLTAVAAFVFFFNNCTSSSLDESSCF